MHWSLAIGTISEQRKERAAVMGKRHSSVALARGACCVLFWGDSRGIFSSIKHLDKKLMRYISRNHGCGTNAMKVLRSRSAHHRYLS